LSELRAFATELPGSPVVPRGSRSMSGILKDADAAESTGEFIAELAAE
jgi:hypothetical protein